MHLLPSICNNRMLPDALERQHAAFVKAQARNPDVQLLCFDAYIINEAGERMSRYMPFEFWDVAIDHGTPGFTLPSTWFFRRELPLDSSRNGRWRKPALPAPDRRLRRLQLCRGGRGGIQGTDDFAHQ